MVRQEEKYVKRMVYWGYLKKLIQVIVLLRNNCFEKETKLIVC